jgi:ElaB/YqjD/DUF883 family membrane-anchored ribosome-binding protein
MENRIEGVQEEPFAAAPGTEAPALQNDRVLNALGHATSELIDASKGVLVGLEHLMEDKLRSADVYARARPYQALGMALGAGLIMGLLLRRR